MFETLSDRRRRIDQLYDETKWRYIWLLFGAGVVVVPRHVYPVFGALAVAP
jgi:hypothetical protein